jgi:hypothetical protein
MKRPLYRLLRLSGLAVVLAAFALLAHGMAPGAIPSVSPESASAANGCGPNDWRGRFVPNAPFGFNFGPSCNAHDNCYGTKWSRISYSFWAAKDTCDRRFYGHMSAYCYRTFYSNNSSLVYRWCQYIAYFYYKAVRDHGAGAYRAAQARL